MNEMLTVFFPKTVKNSKQFLQISDITGEIKNRRGCVWVQTNKDMDFLIFKRKADVCYRNSQSSEIIKILNRLIDAKPGIGIKIYNNEQRKKIILSLTNGGYNVL